MIKTFIEDLHSKIKSRTKEQWVSYLQLKVGQGRAYIQDNGELSFLAAFILGIFVVVFFRLAFALFFIAALAAAMVWCLAESDIERRESSKKIDSSHKLADELSHEANKNGKDLNSTIQ